MLLGRIVLVALLVAAQAQDRGEALREAARQGDLAEAQALLEAGVDPNAGNRYGATALFFAADKGDLEMARLLVEHGARVDVRDSFYEMTPLARSLGKGHDAVALFLLEQGAPEADAVLATGVEARKPELVRAALTTGKVSREAYDWALEAARVGSEERAILKRTEPPAPGPRAELRLSREELARFVGRYQNDAARQTVAVELAGDELTFRFEGKTARLRPLGEERFALVGAEGEIHFGGRGGMIERLVLVGEDGATSFRPIDEAESREAAPVGTADALAPARDLPEVERRPPAPWPAFRGPNRSGIADGQGVPIEWDAGTGRNIRFKTAIPGFSVSSPIMWGERVFALTAVSSAGDDTFRTGLYGDVTPVNDLSEHRWLLFALDKDDGRVVWKRELHRGVPGTKRHTKSSQANATPATDGEHVVTLLGSAGLLLCHDFEGNLVWEKEIGVLNAGWFYDPDYQWGHASSPMIVDGRVIVQADVHGASFLAAFDVKTGEELWRTPRDEIPTFSTPAVHRGPSGPELVTNGTRIRGYDPETGQLLWHLGPNSEIPIGAPVVAEDLIYVTAGYPPIRPIYAIRPGSRGDLALPDGVEESEAIAWSKDRGGTYIPTPLVYRGYLYTNANNGRLTCYDATTGERIYRARIGGVGGSYAASPIAADGRLYFTNEEGETYVVRAGPEYELLAKNSVDGVVLSTPAASDGLLVIRTLEHVYGMGE